jgi:predicted nucleotidyltransferase component of viral defense system
MNLRQEDLTNIAKTIGFRAEMLEKVIRLIELLNELFDNTFLKQRLALKGGTALNLFYFDLPRLSVDIDLNYIGAIDRSTMIEERKELEETLIGLCQRSGFTIKRVATEHAGGKWRLNYASAVQPGGNLEIDLSYLYRVVFWPITIKDSCLVGPYQAKNIPLVDLHELAAGKLAALMSRRASRDLYDTHRLLAGPNPHQQIDITRLRLAFIVYGGMNRRDWRTIKIEDISFDSSELQNKLIPVLNQNDLQQTSFAKQLVVECQDFLSQLLPFTENEKIFLDRLLDEGEIESSLITTDKELQEKISVHPGLLWKAQNVKNYTIKNKLR